jgi:hypothetical protein
MNHRRKLTSKVRPDLLSRIDVGGTVRVGFIGGEERYNADELRWVLMCDEE